jgi:hypothetical protein
MFALFQCFSILQKYVYKKNKENKTCKAKGMGVLRVVEFNFLSCFGI